MKADAKITSKGQITLPKHVRLSLGVGTGDRVRFIRDHHGMRVEPVVDEDVFEEFRGRGNPGIPSGRDRIIQYFRELRGHDDFD